MNERYPAVGISYRVARLITNHVCQFTALFKCSCMDSFSMYIIYDMTNARAILLVGSPPLAHNTEHSPEYSRFELHENPVESFQR